MGRFRRGTGAVALVAAMVAGALVVFAPQGDGRGSGCSPNLERLVARGCEISAADTSAARRPRPIWGSIDCVSAGRHRRMRPGGDRDRQSDGARQRNRSFRRLRVFDGDDLFGERCELGRNDHLDGEGGGDGTLALYGEGEHRITFASYRFPRGLPIKTSLWQTILQMKQAQPYSNANSDSVALELQLSDQRIHLHNNWNRLWSSRRIQRNTWTRVALDVSYSAQPASGRVKLYVDANADGDARDRREQSPSFQTATLKRETVSSPETGLVAGSSIPSHLRVGLYHDLGIRCKRPRGCPIHVDNVQVTAPIGG